MTAPEQDTTPGADAALRDVRDAANEYDYLRRECPDADARDAGWGAVLAALAGAGRASAPVTVEPGTNSP